MGQINYKLIMPTIRQLNLGNQLKSIQEKSFKLTAKIFNKLYVLFLLASLSTASFSSLGQCSPIPAAGSCSGGNGSASNGLNINSGQTFWYSGSGTFSSGINLNGGTIRICGNLVLNSLNFNSGKIQVEVGGSLVIKGTNALFLNGNSIIVNRGFLRIRRNVTLQNSNNYIYNASGATFNMNNGVKILELNSSTSYFINAGTANIHTLHIQGNASAGCVCLDVNSCLNLSHLENNNMNSFIAPNGPGTINYTVDATLNATLTNSPDVQVCQGSSSITSGGFTFGAASVYSNCTACSTINILPVELMNFGLIDEGRQINLKWSTISEMDNDLFTVQRTTDFDDWETIAVVPSQGASTSLVHYTAIDKSPLPEISYYRLRQTDFNGQFTYSKVVTLNRTGELAVFPNPTTGIITLNGDRTGANTIAFYDMLGKEVTSKIFILTGNSNQMVIDLTALEVGIYMLRTNQGVYRLRKI